MSFSGNLMSKNLIVSVKKSITEKQPTMVFNYKQQVASRKKQQIVPKVVTHHIDLVPLIDIQNSGHEDSSFYKIMSKPYLKLDILLLKLFSDMEFVCRYKHTVSERDCSHHKDPSEQISIYKHLYVNKIRLVKPSDCVEMVFNVGPNFLQLLYWDRISNSTQAFILDENSNKILRIRQTFNKIFLNGFGPDLFLTQINVFKCKCICKHCLVNSYSYNLGHFSSHINKKTLSVINHIFRRCHGNIFYNEWIINVVKKLLLHLNTRNQYLYGSVGDIKINLHHSIKQLEPLFYTLILEQKSCNANWTILENKFSYFGFAFKLAVDYFLNNSKIGEIIQEFKFQGENSYHPDEESNHNSINSHVSENMLRYYGQSNFHNKLDDSIFFSTFEPKEKNDKSWQTTYYNSSLEAHISTGKEKKEKIDGVDFISFKTESDMIEYTNLENDYNSLNKSYNFSKLENKAGKIIPTKTNDITKIKGWRRKVFSTHTDKDSLKPKFIESIPLPTLEIKEEPSKELEQPKVQSICQILDFTNSLISVYIQTLAEDLLSKECGKSSQYSLEPNIFESNWLNDYLSSHLDLNVSFKIPTLLASEKLNLNLFKTNPEDERAQQEFDILINRIKQYSESFCDNNENPNTLKDDGSDSVNGFNKVLSDSSMRGRKSKNMGCRYLWKNNSSKRKFESDDDFNTHYFKKFKIPFSLKTRPMLETLSPLGGSSRGLTTNRSNQSTTMEESNSKSTVTSSKKSKYISPFGKFVDEDIFIKKLECPSVNDDILDSVKLTRISRLKCPKVYSCKYHQNRKNFEHICCAQVEKFNLGMLVYIGCRRPVKNEVIENLLLLKNDDTSIDSCSAWVAASAVVNQKVRKVSRFIVPVVSKSIISQVENSTDKETFYTSHSNEKPDAEVERVLRDMVDYTVRSLEIPPLDYDPDIRPFDEEKKILQKKDNKEKASRVVRELKKLINVSVVDIYRENEPESENDEKEQCTNEYCLEGCICDSLNGKVPFANHCGKIDCMFDCTCPEKGVYLYGANKQSLDFGLAKEEMTWHQTVIRKSNSDIEVMTGTEKSKRETKLPKRFRNDVLLGKEMSCIDARTSHGSNVSPTKIINEENHLEIFGDDTYHDVDDLDYSNSNEDSIEESNKSLGTKLDKSYKTPPKMVGDSVSKVANLQKGIPLKLQMLSRRFKFCSKELKDRQTLADVFIWCAVHSKYNCLCVNWVIMLKKNMVLWRPDRSARYLANKVMFEMPLDQPSNFTIECQAYNTHLHSARTNGSLFDYKIRNRHPLFKEKRALELKHNITSYSNSYVRLKLFTSSAKEWTVSAVPTEPREIEQTAEINYIDFRSQKQIATFDDTVDVEYISSDEASVCYESDIEECTLSEDSSDEMETPPLEIQDFSFNISKNISQLDKPKPYIKSHKQERTEILLVGKPVVGEKNINVPTKLGIQRNNEKLSKNLNERPLPPLTPMKLKKGIPKAVIGEEHLASTGYFQNLFKTKTTLTSSRNDLKKLAEEIDSPGFKPSKALKENSQDEDGLPNHGLLCLTPGIGYLRVIEFSPSKISVQDPQWTDIYHTFSNLEAANQWLNRFFKNRLLFDSIDTELKWIIVKPGVLKLKKSVPFCSTILEDPSVMITKNGIVHKKRGYENNTNGRTKKSNQVPADFTKSFSKVPMTRDPPLTTEMIKRKLSDVQPLEDPSYTPDIKRRKSCSFLSEMEDELSYGRFSTIEKDPPGIITVRPLSQIPKNASSNFETDLMSESSLIKNNSYSKFPRFPCTISPITSTTGGTAFTKSPLPRSSVELHNEFQPKPVPVPCSKKNKVRTVIVPRFVSEKDTLKGIPIHSLLKTSEEDSTTPRMSLSSQSIKTLATIVHKDGQPGILRNNKFHPITVTKLPSSGLLKVNHTFKPIK